MEKEEEEAVEGIHKKKKKQRQLLLAETVELTNAYMHEMLYAYV